MQCRLYAWLVQNRLTILLLRALGNKIIQMKILLIIIGSVAVVLAILGIFLPLLPTTPFLLLASACYLRGSKRMHRRLLNNRVFGEYLRNFEAGRGIPLKAKITALILMWASLSFSIYKVQIAPLQFMLAMIGIGVTIFLLKMKTLDMESADTRHS